MNDVKPRQTQGYLQAPTKSARVGSILADRYRVISKLGAGGMGTVYLGEHTTIGRKIAIKILAPEYCHRPEIVQRFLQEARAASKIHQENVVEISDYGETKDGAVFLVMEYLKGEDLGSTLKRERCLPWPRVKGIAIQIARALEAAHKAGIVHRDMKPENCFRVTRASNPDFIKVLDFGIAKVLRDEELEDEEEEAAEEGGERGERKRGLTRTGVIMGTPEYMSPEQASGVDIDTRADIYALGIILYELLSGEVPFSGRSFMAILQSHLFDVPRPPSEVSPFSDLPPAAEAVVLKALQKDRDFRFQTMGELIEAIEAVGTDRPAVEVIDERPTLPSHRAMVLPSGTNPVPAVDDLDAAYRESPTLHGQVDADLPRTRTNRWPVVLSGIAAMVALGSLGAYVLAGPSTAQQQAPATVPTSPVSAAVNGPDPSTPEPVAPKPATITVEITTPVQASIIDPSDGAIIGRTNEAAVEFERSDEPVTFLLRADGHADTPLTFTPSRDLAVERLLAPPAVSKKTRPPKTGKGSKGGKGHGGKGGGDEKDVPEPPAPASDSGADKSGGDEGKDGKGKDGYKSPDLLNPFGKSGG